MDTINLDTKDYVQEADFVPPPGTEYTRLKGVMTNAAMASEDQLKNVRENLKRKLPMLWDLPEFNKVKGKEKPIALVGGGPSLARNLEELRKFKTILSCGSVHDYLINNKIIPTYAANCDPDPICANYFKKSDTEVKYLIASNCASELIDTLKDKQVVLWHCHSEEQEKELTELEKEYGRVYQGVGGGCTVGLRSISIAMCLGYGNIHFFGFDSCMSEDGFQHHAYDWATPGEDKLIPRLHRIRIGPEAGPEGKDYYVAGYQLAQMENFKNFYSMHKGYFIPTFHGDGALPDYMKLIRRLEDEELTKQGVKSGTETNRN